jgi:hypothetical protein
MAWCVLKTGSPLFGWKIDPVEPFDNNLPSATLFR